MYADRMLTIDIDDDGMTVCVLRPKSKSDLLTLLGTYIHNITEASERRILKLAADYSLNNVIKYKGDWLFSFDVPNTKNRT